MACSANHTWTQRRQSGPARTQQEQGLPGRNRAKGILTSLRERGVSALCERKKHYGILPKGENTTQKQTEEEAGKVMSLVPLSFGMLTLN